MFAYFRWFDEGKIKEFTNANMNGLHKHSFLGAQNIVVVVQVGISISIIYSFCCCIFSTLDDEIYMTSFSCWIKYLCVLLTLACSANITYIF